MDIIKSLMIKGTDDIRYAFVNGVIRAKEARLLKKGHFDRLAEADLSSFRTILADSDYGAELNFLEMLERIENEERNFFNKYCLHIEVKRAIDWPEAIHNLKVKLKNGPERLLYPVSTREVESWDEIKMAIATYIEDKDNFAFSTSLDRILCKKLYENAGFSEFFLRFYELYFDLENIRSFFRVRQFDDPIETFNKVFINYGTILKEKFLEILNKDKEAIIRSFRNTPYESLIERAVKSFEEELSFVKLERIIEEKRLVFLKQARMYAFGVEPLFGYLHFKRAEIRCLRQVYTGRLRNLPVSYIKESIPDVWE
ncbi:MAG: V-type ATPase subunit [candidate division WOR-3 bacterium]